MLSVERYNLILELIKKRKNIKLQEIVEELKISEATARRDLNFLENKKKIRRIHGGAVLVETKEEDIGYKKLINIEEKDIIAKKVIEYIEDGQMIYIDAGSTTGTLIKYLNNYKELKIVTNSFHHIKELLKLKHSEVYLLGGKMKEKTGAMIGGIAVNSLKNFNFDIAFLGANGVSEDGYFTPDPDEALVKVEAIKRAKEKFFLCDHTKFFKKSFIKFAELKDGKIISDKDIPEDIGDQL
ncbi:DeoR/GlpR family DNA-binding transcription regulator [Fusobacterium sp. SYSU M8A802]